MYMMMRKGFSPVIAVVLLILIGMILALIITAWGKETVALVLNESYQNYKKTSDAVAGAILRIFVR